MCYWMPMKSAINYSLLCILGIIASGCSPGVIPGVIQEVSIGRSCPAGYPRIYCQENTASITKCPTGYVVDGFGWCRQKPNEFVTNIRKSLDEQSKNLAKYKSDLSKYISKITTWRTGSESLDRFRKGTIKKIPGKMMQMQSQKQPQTDVQQVVQRHRIWIHFSQMGIWKSRVIGKEQCV